MILSKLLLLSASQLFFLVFFLSQTTCRKTSPLCNAVVTFVALKVIFTHLEAELSCSTYNAHTALPLLQ